MPSTHKGSCHCGRVTFEVDGDIKGAMECNCSICRRKGALWHAAKDDQLRILSGEADLGVYQFNTMQAKHYFCRQCGVSPLSHPRIDPSLWVVNLRCVDGVDLATLPVQKFDGEHWEEAARALIAQRRKSPATS
jgi:hypothetical protein